MKAQIFMAEKGGGEEKLTPKEIKVKITKIKKFRYPEGTSMVQIEYNVTNPDQRAGSGVLLHADKVPPNLKRGDEAVLVMSEDGKVNFVKMNG